MSDLQTFLSFLSNKIFHFQNFRRPFPKISDDLFLVIYKKNSISSTFFSHFLHFLCFSPSKSCSHNCTDQLFASFILKISRFSAFFSTLFHSSSSKFTSTTAQFPFFNCKLHFTTAQIVISCTLKYALQFGQNHPHQSFLIVRVSQAYRPVLNRPYACVCGQFVSAAKQQHTEQNLGTVASCFSLFLTSFDSWRLRRCALMSHRCTYM